MAETTDKLITKEGLKAYNQKVKDALSKKIDSSDKGVANGVATLDGNGKVLQSQLPAYVDDILSYDNKESFPTEGTDGIIYVAKDTNTTWRWDGTTYVQIKGDLALGETASTAYRGDRGKTAYDHSQLTSGNPHNVSASDIGFDKTATEINTLLGTDDGSLKKEIDSKASKSVFDVNNDGLVPKSTNLNGVLCGDGTWKEIEKPVFDSTVGGEGTTKNPFYVKEMVGIEVTVPAAVQVGDLYYSTKNVGNQIWVSSNIGVSCSGACVDNGSPEEYVGYFGRLYPKASLPLIMSPLCHIPTKGEWEELFAFAGGVKNEDASWSSIGSLLSSAAYGWDDENERGDDTYGIGLLAGGKWSTDSVVERGQTAYYWVAGESDELIALKVDGRDSASFVEVDSNTACSVRYMLNDDIFDGKSGLVPAPKKGDENCMLTSDGKWTKQKEIATEAEVKAIVDEIFN